MDSTKIHLVCSSGGVKCFSYIGAIGNLYRNKIQVASISACSMGTVIGALVASGRDLQEIEEKILGFDFSQLNTRRSLGMIRAMFRPYATHRVPDYEKIMGYFLGEDLKLSQLKIPFSALALDIRQKRFLVYSTETHPDMKISEVIKIATSIPFMYPPYKLNRRLLVDAAVATESPVWMAVNQKGNYPIVVLKVMKEIDSGFDGNFLTYLPHLISVSAESHDYFAASQITRNIDININCEKMSYSNFKIKRSQIENLFLQGEAAADQQLKEFNYDLNHIIEFSKQKIQEIGVETRESSVTDADSSNAANLADRMINGFKNEISNRNQVVVSFSPEDRDWLEKLNTSLTALERFAGIKAWNATQNLAGDNIEIELSKALSTAKITILLVTPNFLADDPVLDKQVKYFVELNQKEKVPIKWIYISAAMHEITSFLKKEDCINDPGVPLETLSPGEQNIAIKNICNKIMELMT